MAHQQINTTLKDGSEVILKDHIPMTLNTAGTTIEVIAGRVWLSAEGADRVMHRGDTYKKRAGGTPAAVQNLGRHPATIRMFRR